MGDINIARHFRRLKEESNITFEQQRVVLWWTIAIIQHTVLLTRFRCVMETVSLRSSHLCVYMPVGAMFKFNVFYVTK